MAKKSKLLASQIADIKRNYLQMNDEQLAKSIGSDEETVKAQMKRLRLYRSEYTRNKLAKMANKVPEHFKGVVVDAMSSDLGKIDVDSEELKP